MATEPVVSCAANVPKEDKLSADNISMEFEARSARDGAWYDVEEFVSLKNLEAGDLEVLVRYAGYGSEEDEWVNVKKNVRHRSLPCEISECVAVLPGDLILCFKAGKEQALYFDAHVLDAQRRKHDKRGCRCRFLVCYDHDQSEEIVPLKKICRRPDTNYRLQQLHAKNDSSGDQGKTASAQHTSWEDLVAEAGQNNSMQMAIDTDGTTDDGKINNEVTKGDPTRGTEPDITAQAVTPITTLPTEAGINIARTSSINTSDKVESEVPDLPGDYSGPNK